MESKAKELKIVYRDKDKESLVIQCDNYYIDDDDFLHIFVHSKDSIMREFEKRIRMINSVLIAEILIKDLSNEEEEEEK